MALMYRSSPEPAHNTGMRWPRFLLVLAFTAFTGTQLAGGPAAGRGRDVAADIPARLTDQEFWQLTEDLSEPDGTFRSDNVLSNEMVFARLLPDLLARTKPGGVYMGVGPEQNFTYIVAMRARIAFITDIRRANLHLLLVYKALFELSADRAEFLSRLFNKPRPAGLSKTSSIAELMTAYWGVETADETAYAANLDAIQRHLTKTHGFPISQEDQDGIARAYRVFHWYGPRINYSASLNLTPLSAGNAATYFDLMTQTDANGQPLTYLGTEEKFAYIKDLEARNLIVPVVGNFSGPKAIRAIGDLRAEAAGPPWRRSTFPPSSRTSSATGRFRRSAPMSRRCRWTTRACSSARAILRILAPAGPSSRHQRPASRGSGRTRSV